MKAQSNSSTKVRRIIAGALALIMAVVIFALSAVPGESYPPHPGFLNYLAHFGEYLVFAALLTIAFTGGRLKPWQAMLIAIVLASAYAASDELHQLFVPGRWSDPVDWATDTLGACLGALIATLALKQISKRQT